MLILAFHLDKFFPKFPLCFIGNVPIFSNVVGHVDVGKAWEKSPKRKTNSQQQTRENQKSMKPLKTSSFS